MTCEKHYWYHGPLVDCPHCEIDRLRTELEKAQEERDYYEFHAIEFKVSIDEFPARLKAARIAGMEEAAKIAEVTIDVARKLGQGEYRTGPKIAASIRNHIKELQKMNDKAKTTVTAGGWVDDRKGMTEFKNALKLMQHLAVSNGTQDQLHFMFLAGQAAERKRIIEEARKAAIADHAMYGDHAGMNALNRFAKAIEGDET